MLHVSQPGITFERPPKCGEHDSTLPPGYRFEDMVSSPLLFVTSSLISFGVLPPALTDLTVNTFYIYIGTTSSVGSGSYENRQSCLWIIYILDSISKRGSFEMSLSNTVTTTNRTPFTSIVWDRDE